MAMQTEYCGGGGSHTSHKWRPYFGMTGEEKRCPGSRIERSDGTLRERRTGRIIKYLQFPPSDPRHRGRKAWMLWDLRKRYGKR